MSEVNDFVSEGAVSETRATIPARVRRALGIEDGGSLRWRFEDGELRVEVVHTERGTFADFDGYEGGLGGDVVTDHDEFGLAE